MKVNLVENQVKDSTSINVILICGINMHPSVNVLGNELQECSKDPLTGWYRDGCCNTDSSDRGLHVVCCILTESFLEFAKSKGNDLITPHPEFGFPGLKDGDGWCVCATWYARAVEAGKGCPIFLKRTHQNTLDILPIETLKKFAIDLS